MNLFNFEDRAGRLAITLAMQCGFDEGYRFAKSELQRTCGESSCMKMLAAHSPVYAKQIIKLEKSRSEQNPYAEIYNSSTAKQYAQFFKRLESHNEHSVSDVEMARSAFGQGSNTAKKIAFK